MKERMNPEVRRVMESKRILLFKEMLGEINWPDSSLSHRMATGFRLTGQLDQTGAFPRDRRREIPEITLKDMWKQQGRRKRRLGQE